jgi:hypothetical protein
MARKPCAFKVTDVRRGVDAVTGAGLAVAGVKYEKDGSFTVITGTPPTEDKPNSFDKVLGVPREQVAGS